MAKAEGTEVKALGRKRCYVNPRYCELYTHAQMPPFCANFVTIDRVDVGKQGCYLS